MLEHAVLPIGGYFVLVDEEDVSKVLEHNWLAQICVNGKRIRLGQSKSEEEAARIYDAAAKEYFGQYARLNFS